MKVTQLHTAAHMYVNIRTEDHEYSCLGPSDYSVAQTIKQLQREHKLLASALRSCK